MMFLDKALKTHLKQDVLTLATCWKITRVDGAVECYTDHDIDLAFAGNTYVSSGISQTTSSQGMTVRTNNLEVHGLIASTSPVSAVASKFYDGAIVEVFQVNYKELPATVTKTSVLWIKSGVAGDIELKKGKWVIEVLDFMSALKQKIGEKTSRLCRAEFGDKNCRADLGLYSKTGTVTSASGKVISTDILGLGSNAAKEGKMTFENGVEFDIASSASGKLVLVEQPAFDSTGMDITVVFGCNHWITDCKHYNNMENYYGEPNMPTEDKWAAGFFETVIV